MSPREKTRQALGRIDDDERLDRAKATFDAYAEAIREKRFSDATGLAKQLGGLGFKMFYEAPKPASDRY